MDKILQKMDELEHGDAGLIECWSTLKDYIKNESKKRRRTVGKKSGKSVSKTFAKKAAYS